MVFWYSTSTSPSAMRPSISRRVKTRLPALMGAPVMILKSDWCLLKMQQREDGCRGVALLRRTEVHSPGPLCRVRACKSPLAGEGALFTGYRKDCCQFARIQHVYGANPSVGRIRFIMPSGHLFCRLEGSGMCIRERSGLWSATAIAHLGQPVKASDPEHIDLPRMSTGHRGPYRSSKQVQAGVGVWLRATLIGLEAQSRPVKLFLESNPWLCANEGSSPPALSLRHSKGHMEPISGNHHV